MRCVFFFLSGNGAGVPVADRFGVFNPVGCVLVIWVLRGVVYPRMLTRQPIFRTYSVPAVNLKQLLAICIVDGTSPVLIGKCHL